MFIFALAFSFFATILFCRNAFTQEFTSCDKSSAFTHYLALFTLFSDLRIVHLSPRRYSRILHANDNKRPTSRFRCFECFWRMSFVPLRSLSLLSLLTQAEFSIAGSDLLTSLTTTFDRKWRSLVNQTSNLVQPPSESVSPNKNGDIKEQQEQKCSALPKLKYPSTEAYRDPSLHKSIDKSLLSRSKDVSVSILRVSMWRSLSLSLSSS